VGRNSESYFSDPRKANLSADCGDTTVYSAYLDVTIVLFCGSGSQGKLAPISTYSSGKSCTARRGRAGLTAGKVAKRQAVSNEERALESMGNAG